MGLRSCGSEFSWWTAAGELSAPQSLTALTSRRRDVEPSKWLASTTWSFGTVIGSLLYFEAQRRTEIGATVLS